MSVIGTIGTGDSIRGRDAAIRGPATGSDVGKTLTGAGVSTKAIAHVGATKQLTLEERRKVADLKQASAAGGGLMGATTDRRVTGPDGRSYAVKGDVSVDTSSVRNDPQATIRKMIQVHRAASAPASPSAQDQKVAAQATAAIVQARREIALQQSSQREDGGAPEAQKARDKTRDDAYDPATRKLRSAAARAYRDMAKHAQPMRAN